MNYVMQTIFSLSALASLGFFIIKTFKTWNLFHQVAKGEELDRYQKTFNRLKYLLIGGFIQKRMFKKIVPAIFHTFIFWGFIVVTIGTIETLLFGFTHKFTFNSIFGHLPLYNFYVSSQDLANGLVLISVLALMIRRFFFPPERLASLSKAAKKDAYIVLSLIFMLVFTSLIYIGAKELSFETTKRNWTPCSTLIINFINSLLPIGDTNKWEQFSYVFWWFHSLTFFSFLIYLPHSKHQHLIWAWPNIFFKSFKSSAYLKPMEFNEEAESFGVGHVENFTWKQMLDGMTCVECGRCSEVCPAHTTGKTLDPRKIVHHLKEAFQQEVTQVDKKDRNKTNPTKKLIGDIVTTDELWACTTCGACMEACPLHIEHIPAIIDMRRYLTMTEGDLPKELQTTLENLENYHNPWGFNNNTRADWAQDLDVPIMKDLKEKNVDYLFWVGCAGSFDERYKKVSRSIVKILNDANVSFAILGKEEKCNGDSARRAGNEYLADMQIKENIQTLNNYNVKKIITSCPHCFNTIKNEYPDFGFQAEVVHHSTFINSLLDKKKLKLASSKSSEKISFHDSCYLGRHNNIYESPRKAIEASGHTLVEMPRNKENGMCCGAGGARMWMEETQGEKININRAKEALKTKASTIATACPFCMTMLKDGIESQKSEASVKDIAEIIAEKS